MSRERFFIIDAFAHIFRAYYAVKRIDNNAVFGFTTVLKKLIKDENPEYIAVAFDTPQDTFRKEMYPEYKANRDAMPEDLRPQIPLIKELVEAMNIPIVEAPGFEADDIMGTLALRAAEAGVQGVIVSGDKDMLQLLKKDDVVLFDAKKDIRYLGEEGVKDYFGVEPHQIIDLLTLWGDSADNIPGVPGIGEKTAKKLLEEYGNIDGIYENLDKFKGKRLENLTNSKDKIPLMRDLVTIRTDMDLPFDKEKYRARGAHPDKLFGLFERLNFKTLLKDITIEMDSCKKDYELLNDVDRLKEWAALAKEKGFMVFDTETTSLVPVEAQLVGVALAIDADHVGYVPLRHKDSDEAFTAAAEDILKDLLADADLRKCAHNAKYDLSVLSALGWQCEGIFEDTMLMSYLISPGDTRHGLDDLAENVLRYQTIHYEDVTGKGKDQVSFAEVELQTACNYAAEDADVTMRLYEHFLPELEKQNLVKVYEEVERPLVPVLTRMELAGVSVDVPFLEAMSADMQTKIDALEEEIYELAGERFNIKSTKQLGVILFEKLELPIVKKTSKTGSYSTDHSVLEKLAAKGHALPAKMVEYREVTKLKSTYVDTLPKMVNAVTGRIHGSFNQTVTATGRLSSNNPNLQNIPIRTEMGMEIRAGFVPKDGNVFVAADYSQIELRLMAHFSEDKTLISAFCDGEDIHTRTASEIMDVDKNLVDASMRSMAKSINFGLIYGMGEFRLAQELGITRKQAKEYIEAYFEKMPGVLTFRDGVIAAAEKAEEVRTYMGRKRDLPEINSRNGNLKAQGERLAVNTKIQGSAAELIKLAMVELDKRLRTEFPEARLLMQVHDELVLECAAGDADGVAALLKDVMEGIVSFKVPLTVDAHIAQNWKEAK